MSKQLRVYEQHEEQAKGITLSDIQQVDMSQVLKYKLGDTTRVRFEDDVASELQASNPKVADIVAYIVQSHSTVETEPVETEPVETEPVEETPVEETKPVVELSSREQDIADIIDGTKRSFVEQAIDKRAYAIALLDLRETDELRFPFEGGMLLSSNGLIL